MQNEICFKDLSSEELRKLQLKLTGILSEFADFCEKHGLTYFLSAGTCLGAVRHKGFIPWDDDLDVCLPRPDYEKLTLLWNKEHPDGRFVLCRPGENELTGVHITQIKDASTTCVYAYSEKYDICQGIKIDVEPLDGAPKGRFARFRQDFNANLYGLFAAQRVPLHNQPGWKKLVAKIVLPVFKHKHFCYKVFSKAERKVKKYDIANASYVKWNYGAVYDKDLFLPVKKLEFEGRMYSVPNKYDEFLTMMYKDYMSLPPEDKRFPVSKVLKFDLDHAYVPDPSEEK